LEQVESTAVDEWDPYMNFDAGLGRHSISSFCRYSFHAGSILFISIPMFFHIWTKIVATSQQFGIETHPFRCDFPTIPNELFANVGHRTIPFQTNFA